MNSAKQTENRLVTFVQYFVRNVCSFSCFSDILISSFISPGLNCVVQERIRHTTSFLPNLPSAQHEIKNPVFTKEDFLSRALPSLPHW